MVTHMCADVGTWYHMATYRSTHGLQAFVYRNLVPEYLFLAENGYPQLIDFRYAKSVQVGECMHHTPHNERTTRASTQCMKPTQ